MVAGAFQSTGWPAVVATVGNWFGPGKSVAPSSLFVNGFFFSLFLVGGWGMEGFISLLLCPVVGFCVD